MAKYVGLFKMSTPALLIRDLDVVNNVLVANYQSFDMNDFFVDEKADPLVSENPFLKWGHAWRESRSQVSGLFTMAKVRQSHPLVAGTCEKLLDYIEQNRAGDFDAKEVRNGYESWLSIVVRLINVGLVFSSSSSTR